MVRLSTNFCMCTVLMQVYYSGTALFLLQNGITVVVQPFFIISPEPRGLLSFNTFLGYLALASNSRSFLVLSKSKLMRKKQNKTKTGGMVKLSTASMSETKENRTSFCNHCTCLFGFVQREVGKNIIEHFLLGKCLHLRLHYQWQL